MKVKMLAAVLLLCLASTQVLGDCVVSTTFGIVRGSIMTSRGGREFCAYKSIPYAAPPIGELRFKFPAHPTPWTGELDATADAPKCVQPDLYIRDVIVGQEDCLYLNVFTPQTSASQNMSLPVLFFIHGGGFIGGTGSTYGPQHLLDREVILVTINYRLGALGFLSSGDDISPGNYAFKDQLASLHWTSENIAGFGGDPKKVTIQGESAGSFSVHALMLSPQSAGLFRSAISESGSAFSAQFLPPMDPLLLAKEQAEAVNCSTDDAAAVFDCLRQVDATTLIEKQILNFWPCVIEKPSDSNPQPFYTASPLEIGLSGNFTKVPWLMGVNSEEGLIFVRNDILQQSGMDYVNSNFDSLPTSDLFVQFSVNESLIQQTWDTVADFYLGDNHTITLDNAVDFIHIYSDRYMTFPIHKASLIHAKVKHYPVYKYVFAYQGMHVLAGLTYDNNTQAHIGASHTDELMYLFQIPGDSTDWSANDLEVMETFLTLWENFVTYGNPTPDNADNPQGVVWPPVDNDSGHIQYYKLGQDNFESPLVISLGQDLYKDRVEFWDSLSLRENEGQ